MPKAKPIPEAKSAACFADPKYNWIYRFSLDLSRKADLGCPAIFVEPVFRRGRITGLHLTYMQVPNHGETYYIDAGKHGSDRLTFSGWSGTFGPVVSWCSEHRACALYVYVPDTDHFCVDVLTAGITIWLKGWNQR